MSDDLLTTLYKDILSREKFRNPRNVATYYLNQSLWKLHDNFYSTVENKDLKRVIVIAPRGHGKSEVFTHTMPVWSYLNNHNIRILIAAKAREQGMKSLSLIKQDFERNPRILTDFGDLKSTPWTDDKIYLQRDSTINLKDPTVETVGVEGTITGSHFDLIIADDILDDENCKTEKRRQSIATWFKKTVEPLLEPTGRLFVIGTRKHYRDLYQYLLDNEIWYHLACRYQDYGDHKRCGYRAIIKEPGKYNKIYDDNGILKEIIVESDYEILLPERWTIEKLLMNQISMGTPIFNSEFQNDPTSLEGLLLDEEWIQYYKSITEVESIPFNIKVMAFDLAISEKSIERGDYFAGVVVGLSPTNTFYVIDLLKEHLDFPSQVRKILNWYDLHKPDFVVIETNAYQKALSQHLKDISLLPIIEHVSVKDKYTRLMQITPYFEGKKIFIREGMDEFVTEYKEFPRGEHEDLLDALQMAVSEIVKRSTDYAILGWGPSWRRKPGHDEPSISFGQKFK